MVVQLGIRRVFAREGSGVEDPESPARRFSPFGRAVFDAGLVPTIKSIISLTNQGDYFVLSVYYGIDTLARFCQTGSSEQRRALSKQILDNDILTVVYDVRVWIFRRAV